MKHVFFLVPILCSPLMVLGANKDPAYSRSSLLVNTPFASPQSGQRGSTESEIELRGFFGTEDSMLVSIRKVKTGFSAWVAVGGSFDGWVVESVSPAQGKVILAASDRRLALSLASEATPAPPPVRPTHEDAAEPTSASEPDSPANASTAQAAQEELRRGLEALRASHPEYFKPGMTPEQSRDARAARAEVHRAARRALIATGADSPADDTSESPAA